ncbi:tryptophan-rich antigen, putative, partial [Plasmodium malariae]
AGENDQPIDDIDALQLTEGDKGNYGDNDMQEEQQNDDMFNEHDGELGEPVDNNALLTCLLDGHTNIHETVNKINYWSIWMGNVRKEMSAFMKHVKEYEKTWKTEKNDEFEKFTLYLEKRWIHFNGNINTNCSSDFLLTSKEWSYEMWKKWLKHDGMHLLDNQFRKWMDYNKYELYIWVRTEWVKWILLRINDLDEKVWKKEEKTGRIEEWSNYVKKVEKHISNKKKIFLNNWDKEMTKKYNQWKKKFVKTMVYNQQWNIWLKELEQKNEVNVDAVHS